MNTGRTSSRMRAAMLVLISWLGLTPAWAQDELPLGTHAWNVSMPNGDLTGTVEDMNVKVLGGYVRVTREYGAMRWKVNPNWAGLTTEDFLKQYVPGYFFSMGSCYVSDPREDCIPSGGGNSVATLPDYDPYPTQINGVWFDRNFGAQEYGRIGVLYRNSIGFKRRQGGVFVLEEQPRYLIREAQVPTIPLSAGPDSHPSPGIPGSGGLAVTLANGYRWQDRSGDFLEYDARGRLVSYGDRNNNRVWMQYNAGNRLERVLDHFGVTVLTLHYTDEQLTEIRDYPRASLPNDLPQRRVQYRYDSSGRLQHVIDVRGNQTTYGYTSGRLTSITDPEGRVKVVTYGPTGRVAKVTEPDASQADYEYSYDKGKKHFYVKVKGPEAAGGRRVEDYTYDDKGRMVRMDVNGRTELEMSQNGRVERFTDGRGNVTETRRNEYEQTLSETYADGASISFGYDPRFQLLSSYRDENGASDSYERDDKGNVIRVVQAVGRPEQKATIYRRDALGRVESVTREAATVAGQPAPAAVVLHGYDSLGNEVSTTNAEGDTATYTYNRLGEVTGITSPERGRWQLEYDAAGNRTKIISPNEHAFKYTYDRVGNLKQILDPLGKTESYEYDAAGRTTQVIDAFGKASTYQYNGWGLTTQEKDADGRTTTNTYDRDARPSRTSDGNNNAIDMAYVAEDGTPTSSFLPTELRYPTFKSLQRYDARNRLTLETKVLGQEGLVTSYKYNGAGDQTEITDANGRTRYFAYDAFGRPTRFTDSLGKSVDLTWDTRNNLIRVRYPDGAVLRFEYNLANLLTKEIKPLGQITSYEYDGNGNVTAVIDPKGTRTEYFFDPADRLLRTEIKPPGAAQPSLVYTYVHDAADELLSWSDGTRGATYAYDDNGRLLSETINYGAGISLGYAYSYTDAGYKKSLTYPDGTVVAFTHDAHGELSAVQLPGEGTISVNEWNWMVPKRITLPGGTVRELSHDGLLNQTEVRVKNPGQQIVFDLANRQGRTEEVLEKTIDGATTKYTYDFEQRLKEVTTTGAASSVETFELDDMGNRIAHSATSGAWRYDGNGRLISKGQTTYEYDDAGNLSRRIVGTGGAPDSITRFIYDGVGRLVELQNGAGLTLATYGYDPFDTRLWKDVGGVRTYYLHSEEGLIAEANASGALTSIFGWKPDSEWSTDPLFVRTSIGNGAAAQVGYAYLHNDNVGTPLRATDNQGRIVWKANYSSFGRATLAAENQLLLNLRLPGQYFDAETGLHYNTRRYYDSDTGRYVTQDPLGIAGGWNLYTYANADPINQVDPTGEWVWVAVRVAIEVYDVYTKYKEIREHGLCADWTQFIPFPVKIPRVKWLTKTKKVCQSACECGLGGGGFGGGRGGRNSFTAETLVHSKDEHGEPVLVPIGKIQPGDEVLAWSEWLPTEQQLSYEKVTDVLSSTAVRELVHITLASGEQINATEGHPIRTAQGWRDAAVLALGDDIQTRRLASGEGAAVFSAVANLSKERINAEVFNLEVANAHTYFVGEEGLLVHNAYIPPPKKLPGFPGAEGVNGKTPLPGMRGKTRKRWRLPTGELCEWDYQHGEVEKYNRRGKHQGQFDPNTGKQTKGPDKSREIEP